ncbi:hypothetical protein HYX06_05870 [Candidatus Woesearchaeota archaeon]|nr:hypothetical protein [Candidatus Woesearchaeota archaeon]
MAGLDSKAKANMRIKAQKSQITMIMIMGIVLFISIGIIMYLSKTAVKKSGQSAEKKIQTTELETRAIKDFASNCLDKLSKDALVLLGKQGGYIYTNQGGTIVPFSDSDEGVLYIKNNNANAAYNIKMLQLNAPQPFYTTIPEYPWIIFPYGPVNQDTKTFNGIFGANSMPPLNSSHGPHSVQMQIETFIDTNMDKCLDFSIFKNEGYDIQKAKSKTKVFIGARDVSIISEIPLKVTNIKTQEKAEFNDFSSVLDIRLGEMYYFIKEIIDKDISDITFNIQDTANNKNSFSIKVSENTYQKDDLISIKDQQSVIYGQPFEYAFGRKNRAPALYYIKDDVLEFDQGDQIDEDDIFGNSERKAEDPDEDNPTIKIEALLSNPDLPTVMDRPQIKFRVEASDGMLSDYQDITANRR